MLETVDPVTRRVCAVAGFGTLAIALWRLGIAARRPAGRENGKTPLVLRAWVLLLATCLFLGTGILLWRPISWELSPPQRWSALAIGVPLLIAGLSLYLWGLFALGAMFNAASAFGVRLSSEPRMVRSGPFRVVRHPMYLGVNLAAWGSLLIYRTWSAAFIALIAAGLAVRAGREERVLASEFGAEWDEYAARVPAWFPLPRCAKPDVLDQSPGPQE